MQINNFECDRCGKMFKYNHLLNRHKSKKITCDTLENIIKLYTIKIKEIEDNINNLYINSINTKTNCLYCNKILCNKSSLIRHINCCKIRQNLINDKNIYINKRDEKILNNNDKINKSNDINNINDINDIRQQLNKLEKILETKSHIDISGVTVNNTNNNIYINNIQINSFGHEDMSHITEKDYQKYLSKLFSGFLQFIEDIHFSDNKPNNHNICIPKIDSKYVAIYEKNKWILKEKDSLLPKFISNKITMLDKQCDKLESQGKISEKNIDLYNDFATNYYNDDETKKKYCDEIALMLFNNRNKINNYDKMLE